MATLSGPKAEYWSKGWSVSNNVWASNPPKGYSISGTYNPNSLTQGLKFSWKFGNIPANGVYNVYAFPNIAYGQDPWTTGINPNERPFPLDVTKLTKFKANYSVSFGGQPKGYNVAFELFLTNNPNGGKSTITDEVMVWVHNGGWHPTGTPKTTYSDANYSGNVYSYMVNQAGLKYKYTAILTKADDPKGTIDLAAIVKNLKSKGLVTGRYISNVMLGSEIAAGTGNLTVNNLNYEIQTAGGTSQVIGKSAEVPASELAPMWDASTAPSGASAAVPLTKVSALTGNSGPLWHAAA